MPNFSKKIFLVAVILLIIFSAQSVEAAGTPLSGYVWSAGIGWISLTNVGECDGSLCIAYGVNLLPVSASARSLSGYAWNDQIGWIKFDSGLLGPAGATDAYGARLDTITGKFSGWARGCVVFQSLCSGPLKANTERGDWDGWIKFANNAGDPSTYAVEVDNGANPTTFISNAANDSGTDYAWGGHVVGWISFCNNNLGANSYCPEVGTMTTSCQVINEVASGQLGCPAATYPNGCSFISNNSRVFWHGAESGGIAPLDLSWSAPATGVLNGTSLNYLDSSSGSYTCPADDDLPQTAVFTATDAGGQESTCTAQTTIVCDTPPPSGDGGGVAGSLSAPNPPTIRITNQPLTSAAISSATTFYSTETATTTNVYVVSIKSVVDPNVSLIGPTSPYDNIIKCRFATSNIDPTLGFVPCGGVSLPLLPNGGNTAYFNLQVATSTPGLNQYSPYQIILSASSTCTSLNFCGTAVRSFLFDYAVGTLNPI